VSTKAGQLHLVIASTLLPMATVVSMEEWLEQRSFGSDEGLTERERVLLDTTNDYYCDDRGTHDVSVNHPSMIAKAKRLREQRAGD